MKTDLQFEQITSPANSKIKRLRKLRQTRNETTEDLFMILGNHHLGSALEAGWEIVECYFTEEVQDSSFGLDFLRQILKRGGSLYQVSNSIFVEISEKEITHGMVGVCRKKNFSWDDLELQSRIVALVQPQDPGNVGTILRTLDSIGGGGLVLLNGGVRPYHPTLLRASMGSIFWNPIIQADFATLNDWRKIHDYQLIGTSARGQTKDWNKTDERKSILLFGSEQKGLDDSQLSACDELISIPMRGHHSSLNLAVAAGIILYKFFKLV